MKKEQLMEGVDIILGSLPEDSIEVALVNATHLGELSLQQPLEDLFRESVSIQGLHGVGIVVWREPIFTPFLSFYPLIDFRDFTNPSCSLSRIARREFHEIYDKFAEVVHWEYEGKLSPDFSIFNTFGRDTQNVFKEFRTYLTNNQENYPGLRYSREETPSLVTFAAIK